METITASQVMTREVLTVRPDWPVDRLVEFLSDHAISGAPVVSDEGTPIGVVSLTDVARSASFTERRDGRPPAFYAQGLEKIVAKEELGAFHTQVESQTTVGDIMTSVVFSVDETATVQEVANAMVTGRIHRVLVTRSGKMVGIISSLDLLPLIRGI